MAGNLVIDNINGVDVASSPILNDTQLRSALNVSGTAPIYACRAWVNFNGAGTVAINGSGNVSSITDGGVGIYTVNFTAAMPDTNYAISSWQRYTTDNNKGVCSAQQSDLKTVLAVLVRTGTGSSATLTDLTETGLAFFR